MVDAPYFPPGTDFSSLPGVIPAAGGTSFAPSLTPTIFGGYPPGDPRYGSVAQASPSGAKGYMPVDASSLIGPQATMGNQLSAAQGDVDAARVMANSGQTMVSEGSAGIASGQVRVNQAILADAQQQKTADFAALARWGTNPAGPSTLYTNMAASIQTDESKILAGREAINTKLGQSFSSNPVQWLINQISVPFDLDELHGQIAGRDDKLAVLGKLRDAAREEITTNAAVSYSVNALKTAGMDAIAKNTAVVAAGQSAFSAGSIINGVAGQGTNIAGSGFTASAQSANFVKGVEQQTYENTLRAAEATRAQSSFDVQFDIARLNLKNLRLSESLKEQSTILNTQMGDINTRLAALGKTGTPEEVAALKGKLATTKAEFDRIEIMKTTAAPGLVTNEMQDLTYRDKVTAQQNLDARMAALSTMTGVNLGTYSEFERMEAGPRKNSLAALLQNPDITSGFTWSSTGTAQALEIANGIGVPLQNPGQDQLRGALSVMYNASLSQLGPTAKNNFTPAQLSNELNKRIATTVQSQFANITPTGGIYAPPSLGLVLALPGIAGTPLAALLAPIATSAGGTDKNYPTKATDIVNTLQIEIDKGTIKPAQAAAMVTQFYSTISMSMDATRNYRAFLVPSPTERRVYNTEVPSIGFTGFGNDVINVLNPAVMDNYFTRRTAKITTGVMIHGAP